METLVYILEVSWKTLIFAGDIEIKNYYGTGSNNESSFAYGDVLENELEKSLKNAADFFDYTYMTQTAPANGNPTIAVVRITMSGIFVRNRDSKSSISFLFP